MKLPYSWVNWLGFMFTLSQRVNVFAPYSPSPHACLRIHTSLMKQPPFLSCCVANLSFPTSKALPFFPTGKWSPPSRVSHQKETGLSAEGVSDRRQGRYRQFQHPSSAPGNTPGPSEEPAAGTTLRPCVELHTEQCHTPWQMKGTKKK